MTPPRFQVLLITMFLAALPLPAADPVAQIEVLEQTVEELGAQQSTAAGTVKSLSVKLEHAHDALRAADAQRAMRQLQAFANEARGLGHSGKLPPKIASILVDGTTEALLTIEKLAFTVPPIVTGIGQPCSETQSCTNTEVWVNPRAKKGGSGAPYAPLPTIAAALDLARTSGACGVEIHLAPGTYAENIDVPLPLAIAGEGEGVVIEGSIVNRGGWDLSIDRVTLRSSPWPGGVVVDSPCDSKTEISRTTIEGASHAGIAQRGGTLRLGLSTVRGTRAVGGEAESGTGIRLSGGATAVIALVGLEENDSGAMLISGEETKAYAAGILVARNRVTPFAEPLSGDAFPQAPGVDVRDGALLLMQFGVVRDNQLYGVAVRDGARAHLRYTTVENTRALSPDHPFGRFADSNVVAVASQIELTTFTLSRSVAGLLMRDSLGSGSRGEISHHAIGLAILWSGPPLDDVTNMVRCLTDRTAFLHNERNIDSATLPLPPSDDPLEDPPPPAPCVRVPFTCTWCGG